MSELTTNAPALSVKDVELIQELESDYMVYMLASAVRAIPDLRDGLKPVHRRILYAMYQDLGLHYNTGTRKCAKVVGEVLGNYHPHGDMSVYSSLVRMSQDFSMRYPLIYGHGNFGSLIDGAAAQRYTECRLEKLTHEMLEDIKYNTVDFTFNYDDSRQEPRYLPAYFPNILCNPTEGIATAMRTSIPSHNLKDVVNTLIKVIDNPEISIKDIVSSLKGPDYPTGGIIIDKENSILNLYKNGYGALKVRVKAYWETPVKGNYKFVVSELPQGISVESLIDRANKIISKKSIKNFIGIRDESSKDTFRLVYEFRRSVDIEQAESQLYSQGRMEAIVNHHFLVLDNYKPITLNIKDLILKYLEHLYQITVRKSNFLIDEYSSRIPKLEGFIQILRNVDKFIEIVRASEDQSAAINAITSHFGITEDQTMYVLNKKISSLYKSEIRSIKKELEDLKEKVKELKDIINDKAKQSQIIKNKLAAIRDEYGDDRRTTIKSE